MVVNVKKLNSSAQLPKYATFGSSGFDFHSVDNVTVEAGQTVLVKTGLSFEIPMGYELQVRPRSGLSLKTGLRVTNSPGTVDADYRGEVGIIIENTSNLAYNIKVGDRIAQGVVCPVEMVSFNLVDNLTDSTRGAGGFGSSGL